MVNGTQESIVMENGYMTTRNGRADAIVCPTGQAVICRNSGVPGSFATWQSLPIEQALTEVDSREPYVGVFKGPGREDWVSMHIRDFMASYK